MFGSFRLFHVYGIPIRVHFTLVILLPYFAMRMAEALDVGAVPWGALAAVGLFACVALHELGHSVVAQRHGYGVRDIILTPIGGVAYLGRIPERPRDEIRIALAGPAVSLLLALIFAALFLGALAARLGYVSLAMELLAAINLMLALFNLIPCFPMDGGRVFRAWLSKRVGRLEATRRAVRLGRILAIAFGLLGLYHRNIFWVVIAFFVYQAGGSEYRAVRFQEMMRRNNLDPFGLGNALGRAPDRAAEADVTVGPPPYKRWPSNQA